LVARQRAELSALERELTSLIIAENVARRTPDPSPTPKGAILPEKAVTVVERTSATPATIDSTPAVSDDMGQAILDLMKGRSDISENLLRDQLRAKKLDTTKLRNHIETLLKQGKIVNKGYGNFALKRKK
jgi:hypothetical protein